jgi:hypothetical protein
MMPQVVARIHQERATLDAVCKGKMIARTDRNPGQGLRLLEPPAKGINQ